jgi:hypothetical protein
MAENLVVPVRRFVDRVTPLLTELGKGAAASGLNVGRMQHDAVLEAFNVSCGLLAGDGRQSDDELWELMAAFGPLLETPLAGSTPDELRESGVVGKQAAFTGTPSAMFEVLLAADRRDGGNRARTYYEAALEVAYAVAAVDLHTSEDELVAIERFRGVLLEAITRAERDRPVAKTASGAAVGAGSAKPPEELPPPRPLEDLLAELDELIGMEPVKREVKLVSALIKVQTIRKERGLPVLDQSRHLVFTGNPGTGKSTVARLLAQIFRTLGVVARGHLVETDRAGLVAGYVGQTAPKVVAMFDQADEGVLLIDEAYSLVRGGENDFGREAIDAVVKLVEDRRDRVVCIMAGYPEEMAQLVDANPGLRSRFPKTIAFADYNTDELIAIFEMQGKKGKYTLTDAARTKLHKVLDAVPRTRGFGNGRVSRNLFEAAVAAQAVRLVAGDSPSDEALTTLEADDIPGAADTGTPSAFG